MCFLYNEDDEVKVDLNRRYTVPHGEKRRKVSQDVEESVSLGSNGGSSNLSDHVFQSNSFKPVYLTSERKSPRKGIAEFHSPVFFRVEFAMGNFLFRLRKAETHWI